MYPQVLLQNRKPDRIATLDEYRQSGGYQALTDALKDYSHKDVQKAVMDANLLGRGGAAFPTGMKLGSVADDAEFLFQTAFLIDSGKFLFFKFRIVVQ